MEFFSAAFTKTALVGGADGPTQFTTMAAITSGKKNLVMSISAEGEFRNSESLIRCDNERGYSDARVATF